MVEETEETVKLHLESDYNLSAYQLASELVGGLSEKTTHGGFEPTRKLNEVSSSEASWSATIEIIYFLQRVKVQSARG